jgi:RHS repeat-associated protein
MGISKILTSENLLTMVESANTWAGIEPTNTSLDIRLMMLFDHQSTPAIEKKTDFYFYHTNHLGSSSWITDASGAVNQHLQYLPLRQAQGSAFGEDYIYQRNSSWAVPYTFSGKEKDSETGYSYFGARYYDSDLSIWLSVDPLADKYPSMSAYMYVGGHPTIIVDPNGMDWFKGENGDVKYFEGATGDFSDVKTKQEWTHLSADKNDKVVLDAIGNDIMSKVKSGNIEKSWDTFLSYYDNKDLGKDYFLNAANANYDENSSGIMKFFLDNVEGSREGLRISMMTHDWVDAEGFTVDKNRLEHNIGMFIIAERYGEDKAAVIGELNEYRGLIFRDLGGGDFWNALRGKGNTAFQYSDLEHNVEGRDRWRKYNHLPYPGMSKEEYNYYYRQGK